MKTIIKTAYMRILTVGLVLVSVLGCAASISQKIPVDSSSARPGVSVSLRGEPRLLTGTPLEVGVHLPAVTLTDAYTMKGVDLSQLTGSVLLISVVPSLDTKVCEAQTHMLGEAGKELPAGITRITISRDTPFAQKRFAEEAGLKSITYLSDYKEGAFGKATGLLLTDSMLLARSVIIVDGTGIVRYIQVVPDLSHLPDFDLAIAKAILLRNEK